MDVFQEAAKAAQQRFGETWFLLSPQEQTRTIYEEMRRIDGEAAGSPPPLIGPSTLGRTKPSLAA